MWSTIPSNISLDLAGLVSLADLSIISQRTALTGNSQLLDVFILCPGVHRQQDATAVNGGEYPAVAAMTTGYVFRVENPATVNFLQRVSQTGHLTTLSVKRIERYQQINGLLSLFFSVETAIPIGVAAYFLAVVGTLITLALLIVTKDWWGLSVILLLMLNRLINVFLIRTRSRRGWKGASEPEENGDLLVLLSQDRWARIQGKVDDLKAVTSGQWLRDMTPTETAISGFATVLVYLNAALASNAKQSGKLLLITLLVVSAGLLALVNRVTCVLQMHGNLLEIQGEPVYYQRRLKLAEAMIKEQGRADWAVRLGMINDLPESSGGHEMGDLAQRWVTM